MVGAGFPRSSPQRFGATNEKFNGLALRSNRLNRRERDQSFWLDTQFLDDDVLERWGRVLFQKNRIPLK